MQKILDVVGGAKKEPPEQRTDDPDVARGVTSEATEEERGEVKAPQSVEKSAAQDSNFTELQAQENATTTAAEQTPSSSLPSDEQEKSSSSKFFRNPFKKQSEDRGPTDVQHASAGAKESDKVEPDPSNNLPPNHFGKNVPVGNSTDLGAPPPGETPSNPPKKENMAEEQTPGSSSAPQINFPPSNEEMRGERSGPRMGDLRSSRQYSVASAAADKSRRNPISADNPHRIPSAGGQAMGGRAMAEREYRRKSRISQDMGLPAGQGANPDELTQNNTAANTLPRGNGEGSSRIPEPEEPLPEVPVSVLKENEIPNQENATLEPPGEVIPKEELNANSSAPANVNDVDSNAKTSTAVDAEKAEKGEKKGGLLNKLKLGKKNK